MRKLEIIVLLVGLSCSFAVGATGLQSWAKTHGADECMGTIEHFQDRYNNEYSEGRTKAFYDRDNPDSDMVSSLSILTGKEVGVRHDSLTIGPRVTGECFYTQTTTSVVGESCSGLIKSLHDDWRNYYTQGASFGASNFASNQELALTDIHVNGMDLCLMTITNSNLSR